MPRAEDVVRFADDLMPAGATPWVGGYRPDTGIAIVDPDPRWADDAGGLAERVRQALGARALWIEHVGSTSVPGLPAKPIIDLDLIVVDTNDEDAYVPALESAGFWLRVREPWWEGHRCFGSDAPRCNLHVFPLDAAEPVRHRIFRDWLRAHPDDRDRYRDAKLAAATASNAAGEHVMEYNLRKQRVIREIYARAFRAAGLLE